MLGVFQTIIWCLLRRLVHGSATEVDVAALRYQVVALQRQVPCRPKLTPWDRFFFSAIYKVNPRSLVNLQIVKPDTVIRWHRAGFRLFWKIKSGCVAGRPKVPAEKRNLFQEMCMANPV